MVFANGHEVDHGPPHCMAEDYRHKALVEVASLVAWPVCWRRPWGKPDWRALPCLASWLAIYDSPCHVLQTPEPKPVSVCIQSILFAGM